MAIPSSHILPPSTFRHIGFMVLFMSVIANFCALGFLSIQTITQSWLSDTVDKMTIEIPAYDDNTKTVYSDVMIEEIKNDILKTVSNDPIVTDIKISDYKSLLTENPDYTIPAPIFLTLSLHTERVKNAEERLKKAVLKQYQTVTIYDQNDWHKDIIKTSMTLRFAFAGLSLAVLIITIIMLSATIRTQLKASEQTIRLIHLMGADNYTIIGLFQRSLFKPVLFGLSVGLGGAMLSLSPILLFLNISISYAMFYLSLIIIFIIFIVLNYLTTYITITNNLRDMP